MPSYSGTTSYTLTLADISIEAMERGGVRAPEITPEHMMSVRRSMNLVQSKMANRGVNLFTVDLQTIPLVQGVTLYAIPASTIMMLDVYLRTYSMGSPQNMTPAFTTTLNSATVSIAWADNGLSVGNYIQVIVPVSIGGIILYGFYPVVSTPDGNTITITAADNATSGTSGGTVPSFVTTLNSASVTVTLANHGYLAGDPFVVQVATTVGGIVLNGSYTVSAPTTNTFTITAGYPASSADNGSENGGNAQLAGQSTSSTPVDRILRPISRTEYASYPNKFTQSPPTVYWYDRLISPNVTLWQVPDENGPYELRYYRSTQIEDAAPIQGQNPAIPYRFLEAYCAELAAHLAIKWAPDRQQNLKALADEAWAEAAIEDTERVSIYISPQLQGYFN